MTVMCVGVLVPELSEVLRPGIAVLPVPVSTAAGLKGAVVGKARASVFWLGAVNRAGEAQNLVVVGAPAWARARIRRERLARFGEQSLHFVATASDAAAVVESFVIPASGPRDTQSS